MTTNNRKPAPATPMPSPDIRPKSPRRLASGTAILAAAYAKVGIIWGITGTPFPVGNADPYSSSLLFNSPQELIGWGLTALAGVAAILATFVSVRAPQRAPAWLRSGRRPGSAAGAGLAPRRRHGDGSDHVPACPCAGWQPGHPQPHGE